MYRRTRDLVMAAFLTSGFGVAGATETSASLAVFADLPKTIPATPEVKSLSGSRLIFHGDLFGDGRHVALLAKESETIAAEFRDEWREIARWPVVAAWVAKGESKAAKGFSHIDPPEFPFVMKDLDGDLRPELLIAFDEDGYKLGYRIVKKRPNAAGLEMLGLTSTGEPTFQDGYLITHSAWGRKAWGGGQLYYRWAEGSPVFAGESYKYCADPERVLHFYTRVMPDKSQQRFCVRFGEEDLRISRCNLEPRDEPQNEKPFVAVRLVARTPGAEWPHEAEEAFLFQKLTGLDWKLRVPGAGEVSQDQLLREFEKFKLEVSGEPGAVSAFNALPSPMPQR